MGEPLSNMLKIKQLEGGKILTVTAFGLTGALALEHNVKGYQGSNANACAASVFAVGDSYRLIKDGYQHVMFAGGIDRNIGTFSHYLLDTIGALAGDDIHREDHRDVCSPFDMGRRGTV